MGCLKKLFMKIFALALIIAFFYFGGAKIVSDLYKRYQNPPREVVIKSAKVFGDLNGVESDYQIGRTLKLPNYSKMTVTHKPSGQKIRFVKLPENKGISEEDLNNTIANENLQNFMENNNIKGISINNIKISNLGTLKIKGKDIHFADFTITIEKPLKQEISGFIGFHNIVGESKNKNQIAILSFRGTNKFSEKIVRDLIQTIDFN